MTAFYYDNHTKSDLSTVKFRFRFRENDYDWVGARNVFSASALDYGSRILLETLLEHSRGSEGTDGRTLLDLGCGTGIVGLLYQKEYPKTRVVSSDVNSLAVACTRLNASRLGNDTVALVRSDGCSAFRQGSFSLVALNPPYRAGLGAILDIIRGAAAVLVPGGELFLVGRRKQGVERVVRLAGQWFASSGRLERSRGYYVFRLAEPFRDADSISGDVRE